MGCILAADARGTEVRLEARQGRSQGSWLGRLCGPEYQIICPFGPVHRWPRPNRLLQVDSKELQGWSARLRDHAGTIERYRHLGGDFQRCDGDVGWVTQSVGTLPPGRQVEW